MQQISTLVAACNQGLWIQEKWTAEEYKGTFQGDGNVLFLDYDCAMIVHTCLNLLNYNLNQAHFTLRKLYLNTYFSKSQNYLTFL